MSLEYFEDLIDDEKINGYYHYDGSFTTPTCDEVVNWIVFKDKLPISTS
jgi:carbonic anhydrase